eukprot:SAG11_NODE_31042_length_295_cov_1.051020_1_plen_70_part_00
MGLLSRDVRRTSSNGGHLNLLGMKLMQLIASGRVLAGLATVLLTLPVGDAQVDNACRDPPEPHPRGPRL